VSRDRLRLFCALRLPGDVLDALAAWQGSALSTARDVRPVARDQLHITLAFLGHRPSDEMPGIVEELRQAAADAQPAVLRALRYRETRSVGMLVLREDEPGVERFAADLQGRLERLGVYRPESRPWLPHVTVVRFRRRPRLDPPVPDLGAFSPSDAALYNSVLRSTGAQYEVVESVALGGR
jgi:RNA 2',3'-cyclic 3'-phosphodiesterase